MRKVEPNLGLPGYTRTCFDDATDGGESGLSRHLLLQNDGGSHSDRRKGSKHHADFDRGGGFRKAKDLDGARSSVRGGYDEDGAAGCPVSTTWG